MDLYISSYFHLIIAITFTFCLDQTWCLDPKYEACAPTTCGDGTPSISYPFWIDNEKSYCGYPNFQITCKDQNPVLAIADHDDFIIKHIFYANNSFLVANAAAYDHTCPTHLHNITLDRTPFRLSASQVDFYFLYNCSHKPENYPTFPINCASNDVNESFAVFHLEELQYSNYSVGLCQSIANTLVNVGDDVDVYSLSQMNYTEILKMGFLLDWTAHNCSNCEYSGGRCGYENSEFLCFCPDGPQPLTCQNVIAVTGKSSFSLITKLIVGFVTAFASIIIMLLIFYFYLRRKKTKDAASLLSRNISSDPSSAMDFEKGNSYLGLGVHLFTYCELEEATNNFDSTKELGDGGFGTVYYGKLKDGRTVAVKRLYEHNYKRVEQFLNEVEILTRLRHQNLVTLYGCTSRHSRELLLVYEYVPNGTVADHLHGERAKPGALPWSTRMKIAVETASALTYLHASDIIHRDVKTNNILLDSNFCVKVADFGLSRLFPNDVTHVSTAPQGTPGYVDPDYHQCYQLTDKSDVYSFGVVLIELISSKPAVDITRHRHEINLSNLAINKIQSKALHELVDPTLGFETDYKVKMMISAVAELAFGCLQGDKDLRPPMAEVFEALKGIMQTEIYNHTKAEEMDRFPSDGDVLLKSSDAVSLSPDSVTNWSSSG